MRLSLPVIFFDAGRFPLRLCGLIATSCLLLLGSVPSSLAFSFGHLSGDGHRRGGTRADVPSRGLSRTAWVVLRESPSAVSSSVRAPMTVLNQKPQPNRLSKEERAKIISARTEREKKEIEKGHFPLSEMDSLLLDTIFEEADAAELDLPVDDPYKLLEKDEA
eukprot:Cvel_4264.t1-p1 / transcript=Cvel_4264.t1 / gene=Cvel_4264 / organism=Chromera_velia_CCMP2878 / gene_product=hypothetical protein / transcript_product=hypothetical protein / location=Cvel_scaffold184:115128-115615(+) / protein_length=162 / sequence_SO=supercontig / SO=protein_coding / is_pseudo=false